MGRAGGAWLVVGAVWFVCVMCVCAWSKVCVRTDTWGVYDDVCVVVGRVVRVGGGGGRGVCMLADVRMRRCGCVRVAVVVLSVIMLICGWPCGRGCSCVGVLRLVGAGSHELRVAHRII